MANPIVKINGERIQRSAIESWLPPGDDNTLTVYLVSGRVITKDMGSADKITAAVAKLDNLTVIDDIDGL